MFDSFSFMNANSVVDIGNISENLTYVLPHEITSKISTLLTILQALGIFVIIYIIFNIINWRLNRQKTKDITDIKNNLIEIKSILKSKKIKKK